jgi:HEAT repeat protein
VEVRAAAAAALGVYKGSEALDALIAALGDHEPRVRGGAARGAAAGKVAKAAPTLLILLGRGEEPAADALAAIADVELTRVIAEQVGRAPDDVLARCLGAILRRPDFKPESARVEVVRTLGKMGTAPAAAALADYVSETPEKPPRQSRREAEALVERLLEGGS